MKKLLVIFVIVIFCTSIIACKKGTPSNSTSSSSITKPKISSSAKGVFETINAEEAKKMLDEDSNIILLDVREETEHNEKSIKNTTLLIPYEKIETQALEKITNKDSTIIVYCRTGIRSEVASDTLSKLGYTNVYNLANGIEEWPYETETSK